MPFQNMPVRRLKVAILPLDLNLLWARNPFGGNSNYWPASQNSDGLFPKDGSEMEKVQ
jgi:hypothetical protein